MRLKYGIVGHPVEHSLSPAMQGAAFKAAGMDAEYLKYDVAPEALTDFLSGLAGSGVSGVNVTIPHKIAAKDFLESEGSLDGNASRLGAVNTIRVSAGRLEGFNTDGPGFYRSLVEDLRFEPEGKRIFLLGAGGAARAIAMYLGAGPAAIMVFDVDRARVESLASDYGARFKGRRIEAVSGPGSMGKALAASDLLINATPVGMRESDPSPVDKGLLRAGMYVYDLVYNRPYTRLVREANSAKAHAVTGAGMLLYQGAVAFEIWTGLKAPIAAMRRALDGALKG